MCALRDRKTRAARERDAVAIRPLDRQRDRNRRVAVAEQRAQEAILVLHGEHEGQPIQR